jgi:outer membrane protein TolC
MRPFLLVLMSLLALPAWCARPLTLEEAQQLALQNNRALKLARLKVDEAGHRREGARSDYFPKLIGTANYLYFNERLGTTITAGDLGLGMLPPPFPSIPIPINLVKQNMFLGGATLAQPITQLYKVQQGVKVAASEQEIAKAQSAGREDEIHFAVEQLYYGLLIAQRQRAAAEAKVVAAEELFKDAQNAVDTGNALKVASIGRRAGLLEARQALLAARDLVSDYGEALNVLIGLPATTELSLTEPERPVFNLASADEAVRAALEHSPEVREARETVEKARAARRAAQADYIPDVTAMLQYFHQAGVPTLPNDFGAVGGSLTYTLFDFGKRREFVRERGTQVAEAEENLKRIEEDVEQNIRKSYRNVERSLEMVNVAREAVELRKESERLTRDQVELGLALQSALAEAQSAHVSSQADLLRAEAGWRLAWAELRKQAGLR